VWPRHLVQEYLLHCSTPIVIPLEKKRGFWGESWLTELLLGKSAVVRQELYKKKDANIFAVEKTTLDCVAHE